MWGLPGTSLPSRAWGPSRHMLSPQGCSEVFHVTKTPEENALREQPEFRSASAWRSPSS